MSERGAAGTPEWFCFRHAQGGLDLERTLAEMPGTDLTACVLILEQHRGRLHYLCQSGTWLMWDGRCHARDDGDQVTRTVAAWSRLYRLAIDACVREDRAEFLRGHDGGAAADAAADRHVSRWEGKLKFAASLERNGPLRALMSYLASMAGCPDTDFNEQHPGWLNCANGTVDLRTGLIKPHDPADRLTYCLPVDYNPEATCPQFAGLARTVCAGSDEVPRYLMKILGYAMLGHNHEQKVVFISGPSGSGKSQLLEAVARVLGPVAHNSQAALITLVRHGRNARTENSIRGMRLVTITETSEFMTIDEGQLKRLTGEAHISVDQHYAKQEIETPVTWLIITATNNMPTLVNFDAAMRRRIIIIPGGPEIPGWAQIAGLGERIAVEEAEGILAALVRACIRYHAEGIKAMPQEVQAATDAYAAEQNTVANFLAEMTEPSGPEDRISQRELWTSYQGWAKGSSRLGRNSFFDHLEREGYGRDQDHRWFSGLRWRGGNVYQDFEQWHSGGE